MNNDHLIWLMFAVLGLWAFCAHSLALPIYRCSNAQTNSVHFTDTPNEASCVLNNNLLLPATPSNTSPPKPTSATAHEKINPQQYADRDHDKSHDSHDQRDPRSNDHSYSELKISFPKDQQTYNSSDGKIIVKVISQPNLHDGDCYQLDFDHKTTLKQKLPVFVLHRVVRGEHSLQVQIVNKDQVILQAAAITFYVMRPIQHHFGRQHRSRF